MFLVWILKAVPQTEEVMSLSVLWFSSLLSLFQPICCHFTCLNKLLFQGHVACCNWTLTGPPCSFQAGSSFHIFFWAHKQSIKSYLETIIYTDSHAVISFFLCLQKWEKKKTVNTIIILGCDSPSRKKAFNSHNTHPPPLPMDEVSWLLPLRKNKIKGINIVFPPCPSEIGIFFLYRSEIFQWSKLLTQPPPKKVLKPFSENLVHRWGVEWSKSQLGMRKTKHIQQW